MSNRGQRGALVAPLILIGLGVIFLLNNLGLTNIDLWELILRLWPILLIAIGLDLLIGRRSTVLSLLVLVLTVALLAGGVWFVASRSAGGQAVTEELISQSLEGAEQAEVEIDFGAGGLRLSALAEGDNLVEGTVVVGRGGRARRDFSIAGDTAQFSLRSEGLPVFPFINRGDIVWDLKLNPETPIDLRINAGVGESTLDLEQLTLTGLNVEMGVGETTITLPAHGQFRAEIDSGVGEVIILVPEGMEARIHVDTGIGDFSAPSEYLRQEDDYVSPGYETAENRVEMNINGGVGSISVRPAGQ